jgi:hypothetical protein
MEGSTRAKSEFWAKDQHCPVVLRHRSKTFTSSNVSPIPAAASNTVVDEVGKRHLRGAV